MDKSVRTRRWGPEMIQKALVERINETPAARIARKLGQFSEVTRMPVLDASGSDVP